jgi:hypothetical protein
MLNESDKHDFMIPPSDSVFMSEAELRKSLPQETRFIKLQPKAECLIETREEFLEFLLSPAGSTQIVDNQRSYLPINYLVSDDALFTPAEFFQKKNEKYRELVERREKLSFEFYRMLVDWMLENDIITPDFNALDFKRGYYSWGVPGVRSDIYSVNESSSLARILHSTVENNEKISATVHFFGNDGKLDPPLTKGQKLMLSEELVNSQAAQLEQGEICLVTSCSWVANKFISMECAGFKLDFDDTHRRIFTTKPADEYVNPILQIRAIGGSELDVRFYNTVRRETRDAYWRNLIFSACVEHLVKKTTVDTDKSSFKAVQEGLSLSPSAAIRYIIARLALKENHRVDEYRDSPIEGKDEATSELLNAYQAAYQFLPNMLSVQPEDFEVNTFSEVFGADPFLVTDIIENIISGDQNIDDIESGYIADRSVNVAGIRSAIEFAVTKLGYSVDEVINTVAGFDPYTNDCLSFHKDGIGKLNVSIPVRDHQERAYAGEVMSYKALCASSALSWHCVMTAMAEPGDYKGRHCAARVLAWTHRVTPNATQPYQPRIEDAIRSLVMSSIEKLESDIERDMAIQCADIAVANILFDVRINQKKVFTLPDFLGGAAVTIPDATFDEIQASKNFYEQLESTYGLSDRAVDGNDILFYFVNARITPHYVIPNKNAKIAEVPFLPHWRDISEKPELMQKYSKTFPVPWFKGYGQIYHSMSAALPAKENPMDEKPSLTSPYSLRVYSKALDMYRAEALEARTHHILTPPSLIEIAQPYFYKKRPDKPCEPEHFREKWLHSPPRMLTRDDVDARDGVGGNFLEEFKPCVSWVKRFTLDDFMLLPQEIAYDIFAACGNRIRAVQYLGDSVRFLDGYIHNFREAAIDDAKYAVIKTSDGTYIPFLNGRIAKTDTRAFGG